MTVTPGHDDHTTDTPGCPASISGECLALTEGDRLCPLGACDRAPDDPSPVVGGHGPHDDQPTDPLSYLRGWNDAKAGRQYGQGPSADAPIAPIRVCCGQRHADLPCPDGKVMCCLCFDRFEVADLHEPTPGYPEDVCKPCAAKETRAVRDAAEVPALRTHATTLAACVRRLVHGWQLVIRPHADQYEWVHEVQAGTDGDQRYQPYEAMTEAEAAALLDLLTGETDV